MGIRKIRSFWRDRRGATAVVAALTAPAIIAFAGFGAEVGYWYSRERTLQNAADSAAYSAAAVLRRGGGQAAMEQAALVAAVEAGYRSDRGTLTLVNPPGFGPVMTDDAVGVTLNEKLSPFFTALFRKDDILVNARASAAMQVATNACVLALDNTAEGAITVTGTGDVDLNGCSMMSNSNAANAVDGAGSGNLSADCVAANGQIEGVDRITLRDCEAVMEGNPRARDPYADVAEPDADAMPCQGSVTYGGGSGTVHTGTPGRYCGNMKVLRTVNFDPGLYVIDGGDLTINSDAVLRGTDVTFFLRNGANLIINGDADIQLSAPSTGPYAGLVFFGARDNDGSHTLNGGAGSEYTGALYFPDDHVRHNGGHESANGCIQLIASTLTFNGNAGFSIDCAGTGVRNIEVPGRIRLVG